jgi:hypothetical protein
MALPFLILGAMMDIANLCWLSSPPECFKTRSIKTFSLFFQKNFI